MNLKDLYEIAKTHKDSHKSCGGEPYKSYDKLFEITKNLSENKVLKILEIGTAVGFTTYMLHNQKNNVDTIEFHQEHIDEAKINITTWGGEIDKINFIVGDAKDVLETLPEKERGIYDIIFFDGYGVKHYFYEYFFKLIKKDGVLITANKHLKSTENIFFDELKDNNKWQFIEEFSDTVVHKKIC